MKSLAREALQEVLRRRLRAKQKLKAANEESQDLPAVRRNEKSIALLVVKLMCPHRALDDPRYTGPANGVQGLYLHCRDCKTSVYTQYRTK